MKDRDALLAAILAAPDDDTPRLVYADWLDEHGSKEDSDRAELVRLQYEISSWGQISNEDRHEAASILERRRRYNFALLKANSRAAKLAREQILLARNPQWSQLPCPVCDSKRTERYCDAAGDMDDRDCAECRGAGDLLHFFGISRTLTWRTGFIDSVSCRFDEVFQVKSGNGMELLRYFHPTPWALAVVSRLPVTRLAIGDRMPTQVDSCFWYWPSRLVPDFLCCGKDGFFPTHEAALDALAVAACSTVRQHAASVQSLPKK